MAPGPLLEREAELERLAAILDEACSGRGGVVMVEGPAGIGKSRLLSAVSNAAEQRGMLVSAARGSELERDHVFGVVRQLFSAKVLGASTREQESLLAGAASLSARALGLPTAGDPEVPAASFGDPLFALFHGLYWLSVNLSDRQSLLLCVDDGHWADAVSLRFLAFLAERVGELPVAIVTARRLEASPASSLLDQLSADPRTTILAPAPLSSTAIATLVGAALRHEVDDRFSEACANATSGNPFLLSELLRALAEAGVRPIASAAERVERVAPKTISRAVIPRLRQLGSGAERLSAAVAVLGDGASLHRARKVANLDEESAASEADALAAADILARGRPLAFAHPLVRTAVYADLAPGNKARAHHRAAEILRADGATVEELAPHLVASEPAADPWVVENLRDAARRALSRGSPEVAAAFLERARCEPPAATIRGEVAAELLVAKIRSGMTDQIRDGLLFEEVAGTAERAPERIAGYLPVLAVGLLGLGRAHDGSELISEVAGRLAETDRELSLHLQAELLTFGRYDKRPISPEARIAESVDRLEGKTPGERLMLAAIATRRYYTHEAASDCAQAAELAFGTGDLIAEQTTDSLPVLLAINALVLTERYSLAERVIDDALADARKRGSEWGFAVCSHLRCQLAYKRGALHEAEADAYQALEVATRGEWLAAVPNILAFLLLTLIERGELERAERELRSSGLDGDLPDLQTYWGFLAYRAQLREAQHRYEEALTDLEQMRERAAAWGVAPANRIVIALTDGANVLRKLGRLEEARDAAENELEVAKRWGTATPVGIALRTKALCGPTDEQAKLLREAVRVLEFSEAELELAHALVELGACLRRAGHQRESRVPLERGFQIAQRAGAEPLMLQASDELAALGRRPRRAVLSGVQSLTASERRIANMAAEGLSNPEIAQALFVTRKTVEFHLRGVYRKLDVQSRHHLPAVLSPTLVTENATRR
jgi:DNA-binding CsgD family transcriptional regulator